jgi:Family of unknown function (DUF6353)
MLEDSKETPMEKQQFTEYQKIDPDAQIKVAFGYDNRLFSLVPEYNAMFIKQTMTLLHDRLLSRGHMFVNEVLDALDIERIPSGQLLGWNNFGKPFEWGFYPNDDGSIIIHLQPAGFIWHTL